MAFIKKRNGTWYIYWTLDGKKHGKSLSTKHKAVADQFLAEFEFKRVTKQLGQQADATLDNLAKEYLEHSKATKKPSMYARHDVPRIGQFVGYLKGRGLAKASQVTQAVVENYQQDLLKTLKPRSVINGMCAASGLFTFAVNRGYLKTNVVKNVRKVKADRNPPRYLSFEEWEQVKSVAQATQLWSLVATAYYTGFRNSELCFLTWPEIDFARSVITITNKDGFSLKNRESRTVPLNLELKEILLPLRENAGYCFKRSAGSRFLPVQLSAAFKRLVVKPSGLPDFTLHTLRHTFASHLVMKGISIYKVSQWLGHRSVNTTMIYAHLAPQDDQINVLSSNSGTVQVQSGGSGH